MNGVRFNSLTLPRSFLKRENIEKGRNV